MLFNHNITTLSYDIDITIIIYVITLFVCNITTLSYDIDIHYYQFHITIIIYVKIFTGYQIILLIFC